MFPLVRVLWRTVWVVLVWLFVVVLVWVSQLLVLGVGLGVVGRWVLLGVGARHSWLRAWWVVLVGLPWCPSGVSGGPAAPLAEGCWVLVLLVFLCCVRFWCGRCSRFGVSCASVGLVLVAAVALCVVCARGRVCGVLVVRLGACPRLSGLGLAPLCGCGGCVSWPLSRPGFGARVWFPPTPGAGLLVVVCPPAAPFACPPPCFSLPRRGTAFSDMVTPFSFIIPSHPSDQDKLYYHYLCMRELFHAFASADLTVKPEKCFLLRRQVQYVGHVLCNGKRFPNPSKTQALRDWEIKHITNAKALKEFPWFGKLV